MIWWFSSAMFTRPKEEGSIRISLKLLTRRDRKLIYLVIVLTIAFSILDLVGVILMGAIGSLSVTGISSGKTGDRVNQLLKFLGIQDLTLQSQVAIIGITAALILITKTILSLVFSRKSLFFLARRGARISSDLVSKYFSGPLNLINNRSAQESIFALTSGVAYVMVGVIGVWMSLIADISLLIILGLGLFVVDARTTIGAIVLYGGVSIVLHKLMHKKVSEIGEKQSKLNVISSQRIYEAITAYRELLVRDRRGYYSKEISDIRYQLADGTANISFMQNISKYVLELTLVISSLLLAGYQFTTTTASRAIATVTIFAAASTRITPAVLRVQQGLIQIRANLGQARPAVLLMEELKDRPLQSLIHHKIEITHFGFSGDIKVEKVSFNYVPGKLVLSEISLEISRGEFVAIVGNSGAGKTTLVDVILGALQPSYGTIEISGLAPLDSFSKWPGAVSYVPQDCPIVEGTIKENLGLGYNLNEISDEMCWHALKVSHLDEFVKNLEEGLETKVGDRGTKLSGGQRQRLGIARALITSPRVLILDEATSALDGITESQVSESIKNMKGEITLLVIAHRLSTIQEADRIYYLESGKVKGIGNFQELKKEFPMFAQQAQLMGL